MASLGQLTLDLVANIGGFTGPLSNASNAANREMASVKKAFKGAATAATVSVAAMTAASTAVISLTKNAADNAREITNQSRVANATTSEFQKMAYAANTVGIEQDKLSGILQDFNDRIGDFKATGAGPMVDFFEQIAPKVGVTAKSFQNLSGPQALQLYYDSLEKANLSQADMTFYLEAMSGDVTSLIPLLADGGAGFKAMADEAESLGIVLSDLDIAKLNAFAREFDRIHAIISTTGNLIGSELSPYLTVLGNDLVELAADGDGFGEAVRGAVNGSLTALGYLGNALHAVEIAMKTMRAIAFSVGEAYTAVFAEVINAVTFLADQIAGSFNLIIKGINLIPGTDDIPLIASFQEGGYAKGVRAARDEMAKLGAEARKSLVDTVNEPLPSEKIEEWLKKVKEAADQIVVNPKVEVEVETDPSKPPAIAPPSNSNSSSSAAAARDLNNQLEQQKAAYRGLIDELYPLKTAQKEFAEDMKLLGLAEAAGEVDDYADAVRRLKEVYAEQAQSGGGGNEAPSFGGLPFEVGGLGGEMDKIIQAQEDLDEWREDQLESLEEFRQANADLNEQWDERELEIAEEFAEKKAALLKARDDVALASAESTAGSLADIAKATAGEQSAAYKAMFVTQKAFAIASSIIAVNEAIARAAASGPFPYNLAAMASVAAATAGLVSNITSVAAPDGMAHDGIDSVPQDGTWLLQKGERVTTADTSAKLDKTLSDVQRNQSGGGNGVTVNLIEDASRAGQSESSSEGDEDTINIFVANIMADGKAHKALTSKYGLKTKGS
ncbi:hypothetical protein [Cobetia sp. MC34]|uniref:hypothetical protein n=1 Tax=Cobetia sp. MC34 TaxID=2785080 RepID=UPI001BC9BE99|nr:hypothetical protein [Cobetia sp. MC34]MBS4155244.1 hypothetical protein [Cobetia sp. MC34]